MCSFICFFFSFLRIHRIIRKLCYKKFLDFPDRYIIFNRRKFPRPYLRVTPLGYINGHLRPSFFISTPLSQLYFSNSSCLMVTFFVVFFNFPLNSAPLGVFPTSILFLINFYTCDLPFLTSLIRGMTTFRCTIK